MRYLLDTHVFLWWLNDDKKLKVPLREIIRDSSNSIFVSVISAWEISIKMKAKKFKLKTTFEKVFDKFQFELLDVNLSHVFRHHKLPVFHKDPFDRMLIAQAFAEKAILITGDSKFKKYKVPLLSA